ncbi:MAG: pro-sigmaK processing inhibitor BofA family protein [Oscillospiraceae bacterium]|nr:pro-sigmaK processing inhibitor BofA family protein [Oscillospiraceae bacterium]
MENFVSLFVPILLLFVLIRVMLLPIRLIWKLLINSACGFACLWLLNWISGFTGVYFPINIVTAAIAGFLGLPGIGLLALVQAIL